MQADRPSVEGTVLVVCLVVTAEVVGAVWSHKDCGQVVSWLGGFLFM